MHQREVQEGARRAQVHLEGGQALLLRLLRRALRQPLLPLHQAHRRYAGRMTLDACSYPVRVRVPFAV